MANGEARGQHVITSARGGASREIAKRQKRYAITMAFRTACFIGLFFVPGVWRWVLLAGAVFLPYVAVILANQADKGSVNDYAGPQVDPGNAPQLTDTAYETITVDPDDLIDPDPKRTEGPRDAA